MQNLLDRIDISKKAHSEYLEFAHEVAQMLLVQNINLQTSKMKMP